MAGLAQRLPYLAGALVSGVALMVAHSLEASRIPFPRCLFLKLTGFPCAFCGTTRSFFDCAKGALGHAWHQSPMGVVVYVGAVAVLLWCTARTINPTCLAGVCARKWASAGGCAALVLVIANWVYRLAMGLK